MVEDEDLAAARRLEALLGEGETDWRKEIRRWVKRGPVGKGLVW